MITTAEQPTIAHLPTNQLITGEQLALMADSGKYELVEGRLIAMAPTGEIHGGYELSAGTILREFVRANNLGKVRVGEVGIYITRNPDTVRAADVLYISNERYVQRRSESYLDIAPDLIVEIMSPHDTWSEVNQKLREYFSIGVRLIWVVDPRTRSVYAYRRPTDVRVFEEHDTLPGDDVLPGFAVAVAQLFED